MKTLFPMNTSELLITQKCNLNCTYCFEKCKSNKDIDWKDFLKSIDSDNFSIFPSKNIYTFGGEPLMNTDFILKIIDYIDKSSMSSEDKSRLISSVVSPITTNGVLIDKYIDMIKKYNCRVQISLDGPKDINDARRIDHNGVGHFEQIMDNIQRCIDNNINYSIHGVVSRSEYKDFTRINEFFLEQAIRNPNYDEELIFFNNYVQIIFEDEITDEDINNLLEQFKLTIEMILNTHLLDGHDYSTRKTIAEGFLNRRGGTCAAGVTMYSYDNDFNVFPCHRLNTADENIKLNRFCSLKDETIPYNFKLYLPFQEVRRRGEMYGAYLSNYNFNKSTSYWMNWCPSTNWEISGNVFHIPSKYDTLEVELQRFIPLLADYYDLNLNNPKFNNK